MEIFLIFLFCSFNEFINLVVVIIVVLCWLLWNIGILYCVIKICLILKYFGVLMFFRLMLSNVGEMWLIVLINVCGFFVLILILNILILVKCLNRIFLFFIMGLFVSLFRLFNFKMVELLLIIVIRLFLFV